MEIPELADLIWLFEDDPATEYEDMDWPVGLHSFRLQRGNREVLFSLDPTSGEAYVTIAEAGDEVVSIGRLRRLESVSVEKHEDCEGLALRFTEDRHEPLWLQTRPAIRLSWNAMPLGTW
ncbi:hypothetical protein DPM19_33670 [Actinomadura craniellae]|uniref:Uncharacterized protein n=1 Tax=Actinomadura craniellae TaxID=2231787 RepID=A0A365GVB7_9ACTN|nr:hypothetical protein [Actinomadura craniellae]RAY10747.1 hypothetical protein DPM19_33670 [Actinomadura craniellae]